MLNALTPFLGLMVALGVLIFVLSIDRLKLGVTLMLIGAFFMIGPALIATQFGEVVVTDTLDELILLESVGSALFFVGVILAFIGWILAMFVATGPSLVGFGFMLLGYLGWPLTQSQRQLKRTHEQVMQVRQHKAALVEPVSMAGVHSRS